MQSIKNALIYGFILWIVPFIISIGVFPIKKAEPIFFQSIMAVVAITTLVILSVAYFKKAQGGMREGVFLGLLFLAISLSFDYFFFIWGPIKMAPLTYVKEIGIGYFIYPVVTIAFGYLLENKKIAS